MFQQRPNVSLRSIVSRGFINPALASTSQSGGTTLLSESRDAAIIVPKGDGSAGSSFPRMVLAKVGTVAISTSIPDYWSPILLLSLSRFLARVTTRTSERVPTGHTPHEPRTTQQADNAPAPRARRSTCSQEVAGDRHRPRFASTPATSCIRLNPTNETPHPIPRTRRQLCSRARNAGPVIPRGKTTAVSDADDLLRSLAGSNSRMERAPVPEEQCWHQESCGRGEVLDDDEPTLARSHVP